MLYIGTSAIAVRQSEGEWRNSFGSRVLGTQWLLQRSSTKGTTHCAGRQDSIAETNAARAHRANNLYHCVTTTKLQNQIHRRTFKLIDGSQSYGLCVAIFIDGIVCLPQHARIKTSICAICMNRKKRRKKSEKCALIGRISLLFRLYTIHKLHSEYWIRLWDSVHAFR